MKKPRVYNVMPAQTSYNTRLISVTIEDLKENRDEIIKHILENTTADQVSRVMSRMVSNLGVTRCYIKLANEAMADLGLFASSRQWLADYTLAKDKKTMSIR